MNEKVSLLARIFPENAVENAVWYDNCGADGLFYCDESSFAGDHTDTKTIKAICAAVDIPLYVCGRVNRFEDIKKMIYAGARAVIVREDADRNPEEITEAVGRFGSDRIYFQPDIGYDLENDSVANIKNDLENDHGFDPEAILERAENAIKEQNFGGIFLWQDLAEARYARIADYLKVHMNCPIYGTAGSGNYDTILSAARMSMTDGMILDIPDQIDMMEVKQHLKGHGVPVNTFESAIDFDEFKLNSDGMIPCITQDYKTGDVLMMAYMTKESYEKTIASGKMTYFSRSRQELWTKGDTSGHYQYVKSLTIDCDKDTILAKVAQIGAACHTGNPTCFFTDLVKKDVEARNPLKIFDEVYQTILDRKNHPKEGSYTNYLFDQGVDKILKKVGEEATEIVIAAKNPDSDELKYEICDFLYHMMVLMADQDLTWKEITEELAQRH